MDIQLLKKKKNIQQDWKSLSKLMPKNKKKRRIILKIFLLFFLKQANEQTITYRPCTILRPYPFPRNFRLYWNKIQLNEKKSEVISVIRSPKLLYVLAFPVVLSFHPLGFAAIEITTFFSSLWITTGKHKKIQIFISKSRIKTVFNKKQ